MIIRVKEVVNRTVTRMALVNINRIAVVSPYGPPGIATIEAPQSLIRFSGPSEDSILVDHSVADLETMIAKATSNG